MDRYSYDIDIKPLKEKLVDVFYWFYTVFMWFALSASLYRAIDIGIHFVHYTQAILVVLFLVLFLFRRKLSYRLKSIALLLVTFLIAAGGILTNGLLSQGVYFLFIFVCITLFLFGKKAGIISFAITILFLITSAILFRINVLTYKSVDIVLINTTSAWVMEILIFSLVMALLFLFYHNIFGFLLKKINIEGNNENNLEKINKLLTREIENRKTIEKKLNTQYAESQKVNRDFKKVNEKLLESNKELNQAKEKAQAADHLKSAFLSNMSHEVRTPLNAIVGFTTLLSNESLAVNDRNRYLNIIQNSTSNLLGIISDIVNIAKIESKQYTIHPISFDLNEVVDELIDHYTREIFIEKEDKVTLKTNIELSKPAILYLDKECVVIILSKLLDNAVKFTHCGEITLHCSISKEQNLEIKIQDTGIGIDPEMSNVIFDNFRQIEEYQSRNYGGTGLGLSIIKGLIDLLDGSISLASELKQGSTISVSIPIKNQP